MDLEKQWQELSEEFKVNQTDEFITQSEIKKESKGIFETLYKNLNYKLMYIRIFSLISLVLSILTSGTLRYFLIGFFIAYELGRITVSQLIKSLPSSPDYDKVTKELLTTQLTIIKRILKIEQLWGFIFIPLSGISGLIIYQLLLGKTFTTIIYAPNFIYKLLLCLFLSFGAIMLACKLNKIAFSKQLSKITENLSDLED